MKRVTIFDYGAGNLHSLAKVLRMKGLEVVIEENPIEAINTDLFVLPGVGAFSNAADRLAPALTQIRESLNNGLPAIGICLGMQLLFDRSEEGPGEGLGVIKGNVRKLKSERTPQIGWNTVELKVPAANSSAIDDGTSYNSNTHNSGQNLDRRIWNNLDGSPNMYFANSFVCDPVSPDVCTTVTTHEADTFCSAVQFRNVVGVQFHPEKSSLQGVKFLQEAVNKLLNISQ